LGFFLILITQLLGAQSCLADEPQTSIRVPLEAGIEVFQPHSLLGKWNGHVRRFGRHPKLIITECQEGRISGTYKGIFGTFPVTGNYVDQTGNITIHVDFSSSVVTRLRKLKSGRGLIEANIKDGLLVGKASIPDLGPKTVRWEAVKEVAKVFSAEAESEQ